MNPNHSRPNFRVLIPIDVRLEIEAVYRLVGVGFFSENVGDSPAGAETGESE